MMEAVGSQYGLQMEENDFLYAPLCAEFGPLPTTRNPVIQLSNIVERAPQKPLIIFIPGINMYAVGFSQIAKILEPLGYQCAAIEILHEDTPLQSMILLSTWVADHILTAFSALNGCLVLCGHSLGARIATAVASELISRGQKVQSITLIDDGPSFKPNGIARGWCDQEGNIVERARHFLSPWFVKRDVDNETHKIHEDIPRLLTNGHHKLLAMKLLEVDKTNLATALDAYTASDTWQRSQTFRHHIFNLSRFFGSLATGDLLAYHPALRLDIPVTIVRTDDHNRKSFLKDVWATCPQYSTNEPADFGASQVFVGSVRVVKVPKVTHGTIVYEGAEEIARAIWESVRGSTPANITHNTKE